MARKRKEKKPPGKIRKALSWSFTPFFNIFTMAGLRSLTKNAENISSSAKNILIPAKKTETSESFEEAAARLNLSEDDLKQREKDFLRLTITFAVIAGIILIYVLYLAWFGSFGSFLLAFVISLISLTFAFRYHFWWFQIRNRKLGCSLREWYDSSFGEDKKS